jgi:prepilin-type N-terminal cleavage/methylation domain-containing protein
MAQGASMKFRESMRKWSGGFTLIELLATAAIFSILVSFSIPAFSRWVPGYKLKGATRALYSDFAAARMTAVNLKGECAVVFDKSNNRYQIWSGGANKVYEDASGDDVLVRTVDLGNYGNGIGYGSGSATVPIAGSFGAFEPNNRLVFDSRGTVKSAAGGYVYLQNGLNSSYAVGVGDAGVISLKRWTGKKWE